MVAEKETDLLEKTSYAKVLFVLGSLFALVSLWAFVDEFIVRRSYIGLQFKFNRLEKQKLEQEEQQAKAQVDANVLRELRLKIEQIEARLESDEVENLKKELAKRQIRLDDAKQEFGFAKADQDQVFYEWKHHVEEAKPFESEKQEYYRLEEEMKKLKSLVAQAQASVDEIQNQLAEDQNALKKLKGEEKKLLEPVTAVERKLKALSERPIEIKQVVIDDLGKGGPAVKWGTVDRCESCHVAINRAGFEEFPQPFKTHPYREEILKQHPSEQFGCTTCHGGDGRATQIKGEVLGHGDFVHGMDHHSTSPLLRGDAVQSSCTKCHMDQFKLARGPVVEQGKQNFMKFGCIGCHAVKGYEDYPRAGPTLTRIKGKVDPEWLYAWIKEPKDYLPATRMPKVPLDVEAQGQTEKVMAYLWQNSETFDFPYGSFSGGNAAAGKELFEQVGCLGCHTLGGKGGGLAAALDKIATKTSADWIYNWIQNPKAFNPEARMPSLRLTAEEAANITAYLVQQGGPKAAEDQELRGKVNDPQNAKEGFLLISQFGCYGCHNIKGFESMGRLSVDLSTFGKKEINELDFGDTHVTRTWNDWTHGKLKDPRQYLTERTSSKMPNFGLKDEEIHPLVVFLKGLRGDEVPERFVENKVRPLQKNIEEGRRLVRRYNCEGCHTIEGAGRLIESVVGPEHSPPNLMGIGARVRPDFMFKFLKNPGDMKVRDWLKVRMPTFGFTDKQINAVIAYFSSLDNVPPTFTSIPEKQPSVESLAAGAKLASTDYFSCFSCHFQGGRTPTSPPTQWAPDLAKAKQRIRYEFIPEWVKDPQKFTPGVGMPGFLPSDDAAPQDILSGQRQKQAEALRDFVFGLGQ